MIRPHERRTIIFDQTGMSLVELMIAMALGIFLMAGLIQVFQTNQKTSMLQESFARVQESGRIGIEMLVKDIRMADYKGCLPDVDAINNMLSDADPDYSLAKVNFLAPGVGGQNNVGALNIEGQSVIAGSDTLTVRGAFDACAGRGRVDTSIPGNANIKVSATCEIDKGDILLFSDCVSGELFSVTEWNPDDPVLHHSTDPIDVPGAINNAKDKFSKAYTSGDIFGAFRKTYFIAAGTNGDSLWVDNAGQAMELVTGVADLQFEYGEDTNGDGSVNRHVDATSSLNMQAVKAIRVTLDVEDGTVEKSYTAVANIRNRMQ